MDLLSLNENISDIDRCYFERTTINRVMPAE